jgi:hypothetical protein
MIYVAQGISRRAGSWIGGVASERIRGASRLTLVFH